MLSSCQGLPQASMSIMSVCGSFTFAKLLCKRIVHEFKVVCRIAARHPSVWVTPLAVLGFAVTLEALGIRFLRRELLDARKVRLDAVAEATAAAIRLQTVVAFTPAVSLVALIHQMPQWSALKPKIIPYLEESTAKESILGPSNLRVLVMPGGSWEVAFPPNMDWGKRVGQTLLQLFSTQQIKRAFKAIATGQPAPLVDVDNISVFVSYPVLVSGVERNETFGAPVPFIDCPVCYDIEKKRKLWGGIFAGTTVESLLAPRKKDLEMFDRYALLAPITDDLLVYTNQSDPNAAKATIHTVYNTSCYILAASKELPSGRQPLRKSINDGVYDWWLIVDQDTRDVTVLCSSILAAAIIGTLIVASLLFSTLLTGFKLQMLLESLLPDAVLKHVRKQAGFLDSNKPILTAGSPADLMLQVVSEVAAGRQPAISDALTVRAALLQKLEMYTPLNLGTQLQEGPLEEDVAQALMVQLLGRSDQLTTGSTVSGRRSSDISLVTQIEPLGAASSNIQQMDNLASVLAAVLVSAQNPPDESWAVADHIMAGPEATRAATSWIANPLFAGSTLEQPDEGSCATSLHLSMLVEAAESALDAATRTWQFDAFDLAEATNGRPLSSLAFYLLHRQGLIGRLKLDTTSLVRYLCRIEDGYRKNPYHNSTHAADVLQTLHMILTAGAVLTRGHVADVQLLAAYWAAVVHDFDHGGLTNDFLINTQDELACLYNDKSPLENHHVASAWLLRKQRGLDFMRHVPPSDVRTIRKLLIELVLATDMKQHFSIVTHFTATIANLDPNEMCTKADPRNVPEITSFSGLTEADQLTVLQMALKCADLGHTTASLPVHKRWLSYLEEEFFLQGDLEKSRGMPISPLFERTKPGASKSQVGFYNVVVLPMYSAFCVAFPDANPLLEGAKSNFQHWQNVQPPTTTPQPPH